MVWQNIVMYVVVAGVGIPAAFHFWPVHVRNVTALALVIAWVAAEWFVYRTGNSLPLKFYFMADIAVIAVIYAKTIRRGGPKVYPSLKDQLRCLITEPTIWDRGIVAIFLLGAWPLYVLNIYAFNKWQALMWLAVLQYLLAGAEAAYSFRHDVKARASSDPPGNGLALAGVRRWSMH